MQILKPLGILGLGFLAAFLWSGCAGRPAVAPAIDLPAPTPGAVDQPLASGAGELNRQTPDSSDAASRGGSTSVGLQGKWFGNLADFDPAEPPANDWNIDLDIKQRGKRVDAVVIISELIPIAANIWDVHIRLDATTEGLWDGTTAHLAMFENAKSGADDPSDVVNGAAFDGREIEYAEVVITGIENDVLQGYLVIHWRREMDHNNSWTQVCHFSQITPVS